MVGVWCQRRDRSSHSTGVSRQKNRESSRCGAVSCQQEGNTLRFTDLSCQQKAKFSLTPVSLASVLALPASRPAASLPPLPVPMPPRVPIGIDDFRTLREQRLEYVDKS